MILNLFRKEIGFNNMEGHDDLKYLSPHLDVSHAFVIGIKIAKVPGHMNWKHKGKLFLSCWYN